MTRSQTSCLVSGEEKIKVTTAFGVTVWAEDLPN
jgi:hypothetical protein